MTDDVEYEHELPDGCPPADAVDSDGSFYATHRNDPPGDDDFRTAAERGAFPRGDACERHGNSIMERVEDALHLCRLHPDLHRYVSRGQLQPDYGVVSITPTKRFPSHHTFWRYKGVSMHDLFAVTLEDS